MSAKLAGVVLSALGPVGWKHTVGVQPYVATYEVGERVAEELARLQGAPVALEIEPEGRKPYTVEQLYIVDVLPGSRPDTRRVQVADRRWTFRRRAIVRDFNLRRRSGDARLVGDARVETQPLVADAAYTGPSLNDGSPWTLKAAIEDVLADLVAGDYRVASTLDREVLIEGLEIAAGGDAALAQLLGYSVGLNLFVDRKGLVCVFDTRDGSERRAIEGAGKILMPGGAPEGAHALVDRSAIRPSRCFVYLEREAELRFDSVEGESAWTVARNQLRAERKIENVLPVPDVSIDINGRTVQRGTWVNIDDYLAAIAGQESATQGASQGPLSHVLIRRCWLGMWSRLVDTYGRDTAGNTDRTWVRRLHAIRAHWRQTYRPIAPWRDKIRSMRAYRAALIDPETGARAPAQAWMDFVSKPSLAGLFKRHNQNPDMGRQVAGWAARLADGEPAPAIVSMLDDEACIFRVQLVADPWGEAESLAPGNVANLPTQKVRGDISRSAVGSAFALLQYIPLLPTFRLAVVLTAVQAAPNNLGRYHVEEVGPEDAAAALGRPIGDCRGPVAELVLAGGIVTARTAWVDDQADGISNAFYEGAAFPAGLVVNREQVRAQAVALAAAFWGQLLDRREGAFAVAWNPDLEPTGAMTMVEHVLMPNGVAKTTVAVAPSSEPPNAAALVPPSVQRIIRRLVQP